MYCFYNFDSYVLLCALRQEVQDISVARQRHYGDIDPLEVSRIRQMLNGRGGSTGDVIYILNRAAPLLCGNLDLFVREDTSL